MMDRLLTVLHVLAWLWTIWCLFSFCITAIACLASTEVDRARGIIYNPVRPLIFGVLGACAIYVLA